MKIELETLISECIVYDFKLILEKMKFNGKAIGEKIKNKCKEDEL